jgi:hypothetical protein
LDFQLVSNRISNFFLPVLFFRTSRKVMPIRPPRLSGKNQKMPGKSKGISNRITHFSFSCFVLGNPWLPFGPCGARRLILPRAFDETPPLRPFQSESGNADLRWPGRCPECGR